MQYPFFTAVTTFSVRTIKEATKFILLAKEEKYIKEDQLRELACFTPI